MAVFTVTAEPGAVSGKTRFTPEREAWPSVMRMQHDLVINPVAVSLHQ